MNIERKTLLTEWQTTRERTLALVAPLAIEDFTVQAMDDVSPPKWHLAHTTWFFDRFLLREFCAHHEPEGVYHHLFNSYYQSVGVPYARPRRGLLARPTIDEVLQYRRRIEEQVSELCETCSDEIWEKVAPILETGVHHEKQHQELLLMDIKYNFFTNPTLPAYAQDPSPERGQATSPLQWITVEPGVYEVGAAAEGFAYDNERPRHKVYGNGVRLASRPATHEEYLEFIEAGGYRDPAL